MLTCGWEAWLSSSSHRPCRAFHLVYNVGGKGTWETNHAAVATFPSYFHISRKHPGKVRNFVLVIPHTVAYEYSEMTDRYEQCVNYRVCL